VPTLAESGLPGFEAYGWYGLFTTAGTPREVMRKLNSEIVGAVSAPDLNERIQKMNLVAAPQSLDEAAKFVAAEGVKWSAAVKASNATAE
jgi:tripartite-type tricarboxylate transporter receptor subunit TctC